MTNYNTPLNWGISLDYFDSPNAGWGRDLVTRPRVNSGSIFYDNLPSSIQIGLLKDDGTLDNIKLKNFYNNKAQQLINGVVRNWIILRTGLDFQVLKDFTKRNIQDAIQLALQSALTNSFREVTTSNSLQTSSLTIEKDLTGWLLSSDRYGTNAYTALLNSNLYNYSFVEDPNGSFVGDDDKKYSLSYKGILIKVNGGGGGGGGLTPNEIKILVKNMDITATGQSSALVIPPRTQSLLDWINDLNDLEYMSNIYLIGENGLPFTQAEMNEIIAKRQSFLSTIMKRIIPEVKILELIDNGTEGMVDFNGEGDGKYLVQIMNGIPRAFPYVGDDINKIFTSGTDGSKTPISRTLTSVDNTSSIVLKSGDRDVTQFIQTVYRGADDKQTKFYVGIKDLSSEGAIHYIYSEDADGEHAILSRDKYFAYNLFCELKKTSYIGLNNTGAMHIGTGSNDNLTLGYGALKKTTIGENAIGNIEIGSKLWGTSQSSVGKGWLIHKGKKATFEDIINIANNGDPSGLEDIKKIFDISVWIDKNSQSHFNKPEIVNIEQLIEMNKVEPTYTANGLTTKGWVVNVTDTISGKVDTNITKINNIEQSLTKIGALKTYENDYTVDASNIGDYATGKVLALPADFPAVDSTNANNFSVHYGGVLLHHGEDYVVNQQGLALVKSLTLPEPVEDQMFLHVQLISGGVKGDTGANANLDLSNVIVSQIPGFQDSENLLLGVKSRSNKFNFVAESTLLGDIETTINRRLNPRIHTPLDGKLLYTFNGFWPTWIDTKNASYTRTGIGIKIVITKSSGTGGLPKNIVGFVDKLGTVNNTSDAPYFSSLCDDSGYAYIYRVIYKPNGELNVQKWYNATKYETYYTFGRIEIGGI